jgi:hypothetical protein
MKNHLLPLFVFWLLLNDACANGMNLLKKRKVLTHLGRNPEKKMSDDKLTG